MKKTAAFITIIVISLLIIIAGGYLLYKNRNNPNSLPGEDEPYLFSYNGMVKALTKTFPSDIMVYGEDVDFGDKIKARKINDLNEDTLMQNKDCRFRFLVINDRSGEIDLPVEEYKKLKDIIIKNEISIYYVGISEVNKMTQAEIVDGLGSDEMLGFGNHISTVPGDRIIAVGFWTTKSEKIYQEILTEGYPTEYENEIDILGDSLLDEFVNTVRRFA